MSLAAARRAAPETETPARGGRRAGDAISGGAGFHGMQGHKKETPLAGRRAGDAIPDGVSALFSRLDGLSTGAEDET